MSRKIEDFFREHKADMEKAAELAKQPCLGRYTGFEDMNGERICEGDVLLSGERIGNVAWDNAFGEYVVEWDYDDDVDKLKDEAHYSEVVPRRSEERRKNE